MYWRPAKAKPKSGKVGSLDADQRWRSEVDAMTVPGSRLRCGACQQHFLAHPLRHHHVVHVHVGREAPAVGERAIDHAGMLGDGKLVVVQMMREFVGGDEL